MRFPQPMWLLTGDVGELGPDLLGNLAGGVTEHGELPWHGVPPLPVGFELADGDAMDELVSLPGHVDAQDQRRLNGDVFAHNPEVAGSNPAPATR